MKTTGKYFEWLERKSSKLLSKNQLFDSAKHINSIQFNGETDVAIIFCNSRIKLKIKNNHLISFIRRHKLYELYMVYSPIIPYRMLGSYKESFWFIVSKDGGENFRTKVMSVKSPKHFGVKKIIRNKTRFR